MLTKRSSGGESSSPSPSDGGADERTPLVKRRSSLASYSKVGSSDWLTNDLDSEAAAVRDVRMREHFRSAFQCPGWEVSAADVTVIRTFRFERWLPGRRSPQVVCQSASAHMAKGKLHVVVDIDGKSGKTFLKVLSGTISCTSGEVRLHGSPIAACKPQKLLGMVSQNTVAVPNLTVESNLLFVINMRSRESREWMREMVLTTTAFVGLDMRQKAQQLDLAGQFKLRLAIFITRCGNIQPNR